MVEDTPDGAAVQSKTCTVCGDVKPLDAFHREKRAKDGRCAACAECRGARSKTWYAAHQERQRDRQRARRADHLDVIREQDRQRYLHHREARIARAVQAVYLRRARLNTAGYNPLVTRDALRARDGDRCAYCTAHMDFTTLVGRSHPPLQATIEHVIPVSRGGAHDWDNCVLACWACNASKHTKSIEEWLERARASTTPRRTGTTGTTRPA